MVNCDDATLKWDCWKPCIGLKYMYSKSRICILGVTHRKLPLLLYRQLTLSIENAVSISHNHHEIQGNNKLITNKIANSRASILQKRIVSLLFQMSVFYVTRKIIHLSIKANPKLGQGNPYFSWIHFKLTLSPSYFALKTTLQITPKSKHNGYCLHMVSNINPRTRLPTVSIKQGYFLQIRRNREPHLKPWQQHLECCMFHRQWNWPPTRHWGESSDARREHPQRTAQYQRRGARTMDTQNGRRRRGQPLQRHRDGNQQPLLQCQHKCSSFGARKRHQARR